MGKYRVCGFCGKKNPISETICSCNNQLINCPVYEDDSFVAQPVEYRALIGSPVDNSDSRVMKQGDIITKFKQCPECGHFNISKFSRCEVCGESLEDVFDLVEKPSSDNNISEATTQLSPFRFVSEEGFQLSIPLGESKIGRDALMGDDITNRNRMYVSSDHLIIKCTSDVIEVIDISRNGTFINSNKIPPNYPVKLSIGAIIGLGGISQELDPHGYYMVLV